MTADAFLGGGSRYKLGKHFECLFVVNRTHGIKNLVKINVRTVVCAESIFCSDMNIEHASNYSIHRCH